MIQHYIYPIAFGVSYILFICILNISNNIIDKAFPYSILIDVNNQTVNYLYDANMYDILILCNALNEKNKFLYTYDNTLIISLIIMFISGCMIYIQLIIYIFEIFVHHYKYFFANLFILNL